MVCVIFSVKNIVFRKFSACFGHETFIRFFWNTSDKNNYIKSQCGNFYNIMTYLYEMHAKLTWQPGFPKVPHHDSILMAVTLLFPWQPCECMVHDSPQNKTHATYNITVGKCSHCLLSLCVRSPMTTSALAQTVSRWLDTKWRKSLRSARAFYFC